MSKRSDLGDCPKIIDRIALEFCSYSRRDIGRIASTVTDVATRKTDNKASKVVNSLREIALSTVLALIGFMSVTGVQAEDSVPSFSFSTRILTVPQVSFPNGGLVGPFELVLNKDNEFKLNPEPIPEMLLSSQLTDTTPIVSNELTRVDFPLVNVSFGGGILSGSALLLIEPGLSPICLTLKSFEASSTTISVSGSGTSNNGAAEYQVADGSVVTISPDQVSWDINIQIQNMVSEVGQGFLRGDMPANRQDENHFGDEGEIGSFSAFVPEAEVEQASNGLAMITIDKTNIPEGMRLNGQHNVPPFVEDFSFDLELIADPELRAVVATLLGI